VGDDFGLCTSFDFPSIATKAPSFLTSKSLPCSHPTHSLSVSTPLGSQRFEVVIVNFLDTAIDGCLYILPVLVRYLCGAFMKFNVCDLFEIARERDPGAFHCDDRYLSGT
jgi:hypothetical protein